MAQCRKAKKRPIPFDCKFDAGHPGNCSPYTLPPTGRRTLEYAMPSTDHITRDAITDALRSGARTIDDLAARMGVYHSNATLRYVVADMAAAGAIVQDSDGRLYLPDNA